MFPAPRPGPADPTDPDDVLRERVLDHLRAQGFSVSARTLLAPVAQDKDTLRRLHESAVADMRARARAALWRHEEAFIRRLASPGQFAPDTVDPVLVPIRDRRSFDAHLWRWCALHWSVPVSSGYGRRLRFLVVDRANSDAVVGLIGLGDPVFALGARDRWVGWSASRRRVALSNVMDAFVLGAVPPYAGLLAGKLVALLATTDEVRDAFEARYGHRQTLIADRDPDARLALVTTTSALGRSSVYNRLTAPEGGLAFVPVGYTSGSGDFHLTGGIYEELAARAALANPGGASHASARWKKSGARNRREVVQRALEALGLESRQLRVHGIRRQVFLAPTLHNAAEHLRTGEPPEPIARSVQAAGSHWRARWCLPRAARASGTNAFEPRTWRLWPDLSA